MPKVTLAETRPLLCRGSSLRELDTSAGGDVRQPGARPGPGSCGREILSKRPLLIGEKV